jgi:hypothetical protein
MSSRLRTFERGGASSRDDRLYQHGQATKFVEMLSWGIDER